jgi:DNA-binding HxlR family transcriptional regulator
VEQGSYGQFCPVAMAAEVFCTRWTALVMREILCGSTRFNDIRRGVPRMSPTLLSKRLKELQKAGIIHTRRAGQPGSLEYVLTQSGEDLRPLVMSLGMWGQRWVESKLSLRNLDPSLLMWDMRRHLDPTPLPEKLCTIRFEYPELDNARRHWWLVIDKGSVDLCLDGGVDDPQGSGIGRPRSCRRSKDRPLDADMARPLAFRQGEEPRRCGCGLIIELWESDFRPAAPSAARFAQVPAPRRCGPRQACSG